MRLFKSEVLYNWTIIVIDEPLDAALNLEIYLYL